MKSMHGCWYSKLTRSLCGPDELKKDPEMQRLWSAQKSSMTTSTKQDSQYGANGNALPCSGHAPKLKVQRFTSFSFLESRKEIQCVNLGTSPVSLTITRGDQDCQPIERYFSLVNIFKSNKNCFCSQQC